MRKVNIDENLVVSGTVNRPGIAYYDANEPVFCLHGLFHDEEGYYRIPDEIAANISKNINDMHRYTAGGRIRFETNSPYVAIHVKFKEHEPNSFMTAISTHGFDVYDGKRYAGAMIPPYEINDETYEALVNLGTRDRHKLTVNFPLYAEIDELFIGLDETAYVEPLRGYSYAKPIVYYGSSITHGACASRPGKTYESLISRRLNVDYINLGFGGSARAELPMAEYVASLDAELFVYDYDHNAPTPKFLSETHERMFRIFRRSHPTTPVVMVSRPRSVHTEDNDLRFSIIKNTYERAREAGDENVYLIDGISFTEGFDVNDWSADGVHPTDTAFARMADVIGNVIAKILKASDD